MEYATLDRVAGEKRVNQRKKEGFARLEPFEEGADLSVRGEEIGADLAACGGSVARPSRRGGFRAKGSVLESFDVTCAS